MPTSGQANLFRSNVNTYIGLMFIATFTLGCSLVLWNAFYGHNPVEQLILSSKALSYNDI